MKNGKEIRVIVCVCIYMYIYIYIYIPPEGVVWIALARATFSFTGYVKEGNEILYLSFCASQVSNI